MRVSVSSIVESQLPSFVREEYPLFAEFLKHYYLSNTDEIQLQNLDKNLDFDVVFNIRPYATLFSNVNYGDSTITVDSTSGFPDNYGLIQINTEIILYESKTETQFLNCSRGFSGVSKLDKNFVEFLDTQREQHQSNDIVYNLSVLFIQQFALNIKKRISPGFEDRKFFSGLNITNFIKKIKDFYLSKGSDESFRILFGALYGEKVEVIRPQDFLIRASDAQWRTTKDIIVEVIEGDPYQLQNLTLYQDQTDFIEAAQGTIVQVQKTQRNNKDYYILSLDYDYNKDIDVSGTTKSEFTIHPKTKVVSNLLEGSTYLDVDSTIGFPSSGTLKLLTTNEEEYSITYQSKTLNQFLDCSSVPVEIFNGFTIITDDFVYGITKDGTQVKMRIDGVLSNETIINDSYNYSKGEKIRIKTLGEDSNSLKANNWVFNIPVFYKVETIDIVSPESNSYILTLYDIHSFVPGDAFDLTSSLGDVFYGEISFVENDKKIIISGQGVLNTSLQYTIKKNVSKVKIKNNEYKDLEVYNANVQNVYLNYFDDVYVYTPSLPRYPGDGLEIKDFIVKVPAGDYTDKQEIVFSSNHHYFTGDLVVYNPIDSTNQILPKGVYCVYKVDNKTIKLSNNQSDIYNSRFLTFSGSISSGFESNLEPFSFNDQDLNLLQILPQQTLKKLPNFNSNKSPQSTEPGKIGILINGVEIVNYKSNDILFYGDIKRVDVTNKGSGYNVIIPPELNVTDSVGYGATLIAGVSGSLEKIDILDSGFNYLETPTITISGGGGFGAEAKVNLSPYIHEVSFDASKVDTVNNIIVLDDIHKFQPYEEVIYTPNGGNVVSGIVTNSSYFIQVVDENKVKLHYTYADAVSSSNAVNLVATSTGSHSLKSKEVKRKIGSIDIINSGSGYKNKKTRVSGINTSTNELTITNHGYSSGDIIAYYPNSTVISGLSSSTQYYVTNVDNNTIKLSGISTIGNPTEFYDRGEYVKINHLPDGSHYFNYPTIEVTLSGKVGLLTEYQAQINPIFSGEITSVFIENGGKEYGTDQIINYERLPIVSIEEVQTALVTPVILNGKIERVVVNFSGNNYQHTPEIIIEGYGSNAILTPVIVNQKLVEVKVINKGSGYTSDTKITVSPRGVKAKFYPKLNAFRFNLFERLKLSNNIPEDDGCIISNFKNLQYAHLYPSRELRKNTFRKVGDKNFNDLPYNGTEILSSIHSPILGWAYDGNPIYGPYGYSGTSSGPVKALKSGYTLKSNSKLVSENRPSFDLYPKGIFITDYEFTNTGDLDEYNGRYCVTPEFPNGTYAYFTTISDTLADDGPFISYFEPQYPYVIGSYYKNTKVNEEIDFFAAGQELLRNTTPYNLTSTNSGYNYIPGKSTINKEYLEISKVNSSLINSINITNAGDNYQVGDFISLNDGTFSQVSSVSGVGINTISVTQKLIDSIEVVPYDGSFIGVSTTPHNLIDAEEFIFNSNQEINKNITVKNLEQSLTLSQSVDLPGVTGSITYFSVIGNLNFPLKENDIYSINGEQVKILNVYPQLSKIKVLRNINSITVTDVYLPGTKLTPEKRKFLFNIGLSTSYNFKLNKEYYFNPSNTVGLGTVGITTVSLDPVSTGRTTFEVPVKSLYIENHSLFSGDKVFYSTNDGSSIEVSTDGIVSVTLTQTPELFVTKIDNNLIGLSTEITGVASTDKNLYFTSIGSGENHSFVTLYENNLIGNISNNLVDVYTETNHNLISSNSVSIDISSGISTEIKLYYNDDNQRLCVGEKEIISVDLITNTLQIPDHNLNTGDQVIYSSTSVIGGLENQNYYFVIFVTKDKIKLAQTKYNSLLPNPIEVNLLTSGDGKLYPTTTKIKLIKGQDLNLNTTDTSFFFKEGEIDYPAFEIKFYRDQTFYDEYFNPNIGISTSSIVVNSTDLVQPLYFKLVPINTEISPEIKKYINSIPVEIVVNNSSYSGTYSITTTSNTSFSYQITNYPETPQYVSGISSLSYTTTSSSANGPINQVQIFNTRENNKLPFVETISSTSGKGAVLTPFSNIIGSIKTIKKREIGYEYTPDYTIRPKLNLPQVLNTEPFYKIQSIDVLEKGINYSFSPDLILVNNDTGEKYDKVELDYNIEKNIVSIVNNSFDIDPKDPKVIPINNDNSFEIQDISYSSENSSVTVTLKTGFTTTTDYPFNVGEKVLIENVSIIPNSGNGYNSSNYGYKLFEIVDSSPKIGGVGATFSYIVNEVPGTYDNSVYSGSVVPETYLPQFKVNITTNDFIVGEKILTSSNKEGEVTNWDRNNFILNILSNDKISPNELVFGKTSKTSVNVLSSYSPKAFSQINSNTIIEKGWNRNTGVLNDNQQRLHDNDYYQYFSYDLRSKVDYINWTDVVDSLNHPSGFKKFGNIIVDSNQSNVGFTSTQDFSEVEIINDIVSEVSLNCFNDFDRVTENYFYLDNSLKSNEIYFKTRILQDYIQSKGNKVILIDDISDKFSPSFSPNKVIVDSYNKTSTRFKKYIISVYDKFLQETSEAIILNSIHNGETSSISQYAILESNQQLGYFDSEITSTNIDLVFYPFFTSNKIYAVNNFSINISDLSNEVGITTLGDISNVVSYSTSGIGSTTVVGISTTSRAAKILLVTSDIENNSYHYDEINYVQKDNDIIYNSYSQISSGNKIGIGTFGLVNSSGSVDLVVYPNDTSNYLYNSIAITLSDTNYTNQGIISFGNNIIKSTYKKVNASGSPVKTLIYSHSSSYTSGLHQIVVEDLTNNTINYIEIFTSLNSKNSTVYYVEFGNLNIGNTIGLFEVEVLLLNGNMELYFTPYNDIDYEIRMTTTLISRKNRTETLEV